MKHLPHYVNDFSNVLEKKLQDSSNQVAEQIDMSSSLQAVTVIIPHRKGKELKNIALSLFNENKIWQKGKNNGLLLILVSDEKKLRIMVWKWLEWIYTDTWCRKIIEWKLKKLLLEEKYEQLISVWHQEITKKEQSDRYYGVYRYSIWKTIAGVFWSFFLTPIFFIFTALLVPVYGIYIIVSILLSILFSVVFLPISKWVKSILIFILIYGGIFILPWVFLMIKEQNFCKENPVICEERQREKEKIFCQKRPASCNGDKIDHSSIDYKIYQEEERIKRSSNNTQDSSISSKNRTSSFDGGWWSTNSAGWWD